jgi:hypothetical protein
MRNEAEIRELIALLMQRMQECADRASEIAWGSDAHREAMRAMDLCDYQIRALTWVVGDVPEIYLPGSPA